MVKPACQLTVWMDGNTHPLVDVHLQRVVVEREEVSVRAASLVTKLVLQPKAHAHTQSQ